MKRSILVAILACSFATPALAADFDGARIEARGGWDSVKLKVDYDDGVDSFSESDSESGLGYGVEIGYDAAVGDGMVIGLYAGIDFSSTDYCSEVYGLDEGCIEAGRNLTAGVRLGAPVGNALVYAKGGYSNGQLKIRYEDFEDILEDFSLREDRGGWHAGAGVEVGLAANFYGKVEYVYTNYNGADFDSADFGAEIDGSRQQLLFGLGYRF